MDRYFSFQWHITDQCDQRCEHCYIFTKDGNVQLHEMSWGDCETVLENCEDMCARSNRVPYLYLTGGDPLLHEDFWRLLEALRKRGWPFSILGNPFHLTDDVCVRLKELGCERYQLSLDGLAGTHDKIRRPGSFATTLDKIPCIRQAGIRCAVMMTVSGSNIEEVPAVIDVVVEHKADVFAFARYCPTDPDHSNRIEAEEYHELLDVCWRRFERYRDCGTTFNLKDHLWTLYLYEKGLFTIPAGLDEQTIYDGCNCGISHLTILPNGDVCACRRMDSTVGNMLTDRLAELFLGSRMDEYRAYHRFVKCSKCELLRFCRGCPAVAYGHARDPYNADPQCWKEAS